MGKSISFILAILVAGFVVFHLNDPWRNIQPSDLYSAVISTDGAICPGSRQDFLVNVFREVDGGRIFENKARLGAKFVIPHVRGNVSESIVPLIYCFPGKYTCSFNFPEDIDMTSVKMSVFPDSRSDKAIMACDIPVKIERSIVVLPPSEQVYAGDFIKFRIASVEKKTGLGIPKIPVRIRMITPSDVTTLNRIVTTDNEGLADFKTFIHAASPEGFYRFIFQSGEFEQKVSIYIKRQKEGEVRLAYLETVPSYMNDFDTNETCGYIFNLNTGKTDALMAYGCPDSDHRQVEIWQNGRLNYYADLNLEGGTVSLVFHKELLAGCPALFKVWQISGNDVVSHEKIRYIASNKPNRLAQLLIDVNSEFLNTERDRLALSLARRGFLGTSEKFNSDNLTRIYSQDLRAIYPNPVNEIPIKYYEDLFQKYEQVLYRTRFSMVEGKKEINLNREKCEILLDSSEFLTHYINALAQEKPTIANLVQESVCRVERFDTLALYDKQEELEKLEGILIPLSEAYLNLNFADSDAKNYRQSILGAVNKVRSVVFVPPELLQDITHNKDAYGVPMLDIEPMNRSFQSIKGVLKRKGKAGISYKDITSVIDLSESKINLNQVASFSEDGSVLLSCLRDEGFILEQSIIEEK